MSAPRTHERSRRMGTGDPRVPSGAVDVLGSEPWPTANLRFPRPEPGGVGEQGSPGLCDRVRCGASHCRHLKTITIRPPPRIRTVTPPHPTARMPTRTRRVQEVEPEPRLVEETNWSFRAPESLVGLHHRLAAATCEDDDRARQQRPTTCGDSLLRTRPVDLRCIKRSVTREIYRFIVAPSLATDHACSAKADGIQRRRTGGRRTAQERHCLSLW